MASTAVVSGDALEDDFQLEEEVGHGQPESEAMAVPLDSEPQVEVDEAEEGSVRKSAGSKKRKGTKEPSNKAKRSKVSASEDTEPVACAPPDLQTDYYHRKLKVAFPKASSLELDEMQIAQKHIMDVSSVNASSRHDLAQFLQAALPEVSQQLAKPSKKKGSPRVIVVSAAALRVADLCRQAKALAGKGEVAKLFSKHCKLSEHEAFCRDKAFSIAVATPSRLEKLIHSNSLGLDSVSHLVLDVSFLDSKKRSVLENEGKEIIFRDILGDERIREKLGKDRLKLVFF